LNFLELYEKISCSGKQIKFKIIVFLIGTIYIKTEKPTYPVIYEKKEDLL